MLRQLEKIILLQTIDNLWKDHLLNMDHLKEGIGLRGYGQKNPLQEYQKEGYDMFEEMIHRKEEDVVQKLFTVELARETVAQQMEMQQPRPQRMVLSHGRERPIAAQPVHRRSGKAKKWVATIPVHAVAARNTNAATVSNAPYAVGLSPMIVPFAEVSVRC